MDLNASDSSIQLYSDFTTTSVILGTPTHMMPQAQRNLGHGCWPFDTDSNHAKV